jgi:hypothetical protein
VLVSPTVVEATIAGRVAEWRIPHPGPPLARRGLPTQGGSSKAIRSLVVTSRSIRLIITSNRCGHLECATEPSPADADSGRVRGGYRGG